MQHKRLLARIVLATSLIIPGLASAIPASIGDAGLFFWNMPNSSADFYNPNPGVSGNALAINFAPDTAFFVADRLAPGDIFAPIVSGNIVAWSLSWFDNFGNFHGVLTGLNGTFAIDLAVPTTTCGPPGFNNCLGLWSVETIAPVPVPGTIGLFAAGIFTLLGLGGRRRASA